MMRAEYDSEADALGVEFGKVDRLDYNEDIDGDYCSVGILNGRVRFVELLSPNQHLDLLQEAATRFGLDPEGLAAAANAALSAPDRSVTLEIGVRAPMAHRRP